MICSGATFISKEWISHIKPKYLIWWFSPNKSNVALDMHISPCPISCANHPLCVPIVFCLVKKKITHQLHHISFVIFPARSWDGSQKYQRKRTKLNPSTLKIPDFSRRSSSITHTFRAKAFWCLVQVASCWSMKPRNQWNCFFNLHFVKAEKEEKESWVLQSGNLRCSQIFHKHHGATVIFRPCKWGLKTPRNKGHYS